MKPGTRTFLKVMGIFFLVLVLLRAWWAWGSSHQEAESTQIHPIEGLFVQYVLTPDRCVSLGGMDGTEFDVEPNGSVLVKSQGALLEIGSNGEGLAANPISDKAPESFALDGQGTLLSISGQYFGQFENNEFSQLVPLPYPGMRLAASSLPGAAYLIGGSDASANRVYTFFADGTLQIEAEIPEPVTAVTDNSASIYLSSSQALFRVRPTGIETVIRLPEEFGKILSVAAAPDDKALYFATEHRTFVMSGLSAVALVQDLGGSLRFRNNKLYVWSPTRQILVALSGMQERLDRERATP